jgi:hypothetical protein
MNDTKAAHGRVPASGGPVDPSVLHDLVAANHICARQGVLGGYDRPWRMWKEQIGAR